MGSPSRPYTSSPWMNTPGDFLETTPPSPSRPAVAAARIAAGLALPVAMKTTTPAAAHSLSASAVLGVMTHSRLSRVPSRSRTRQSALREPDPPAPAPYAFADLAMVATVGSLERGFEDPGSIPRASELSPFRSAPPPEPRSYALAPLRLDPTSPARLSSSSSTPWSKPKSSSSTRAISAAAASPSSWSNPHRCSSPCTRRTLHSSSNP
mmetsp:Transcript_1248/g.4670  ORF Transcript_1248/g.4670 Transcript_1248/m.4670 type:complete len:209 (+) Transcript_1248:733-1359(+)